MLAWEGDIWIDIKSMLIQSEELEKADTLRMVNLLAPLFDQTKYVKEDVAKLVKQILLTFNKDPNKWLPDRWLGKVSPIQPFEQPSKQRSERTVVPPRELESKPSLVERLKSAFQAFRTPYGV